MARRFVKFQNFRNIGVSKDDARFDQFNLNSSLERENVGELLIAIGENNVGKSNALDGIAKIKPHEDVRNINLKEAVADFMDYENAKPRIKLVYDDVDGKSYDIEYFLNDEEKTRYQLNMEMQDKVIESKEIRKVLNLAPIDEEFEEKFNAFEEVINEYPEDSEMKKYKRDLASLRKFYKSLVANTESIDIKKLKDTYIQLQTISNAFAESHYLDELDFINLDTIIDYKEKEVAVEKTVKVIKDVIQEKYGISFIPKIIFYKEEEIKNEDLITTPAKISESRFFKALLKAAGKSLSTVTRAYEKAGLNPGYKGQYEDSINEGLKKIVNKKFNDLYFQGMPTQEYNFYIRLEKDEIYLSMEKNGNIILLSQQSTGFKWFFNFYFNFLHANDLQPGDIVLMDEPEIHLAPNGKRDLRKLIKEYAKETGITFITTTQHTDFIDPDYLDELRIIKHKKGEGEVGAEIQNDFSAIGEDDADTINEILTAFGVQHRDIITNPDNRVIYVEGITDYNYLTAFRLLKEKEENRKINLVFLPINGLGKNEEQMKKKLCLLGKYKKAVILTDSDEKAEMFKKARETDEQIKARLDILQLEEADGNFKVIENLFTEGDKARYGLNGENKGAASTLFKRKVYNLLEDLKDESAGTEAYQEALHQILDAQTKDNFYALLKYIEDNVL